MKFNLQTLQSALAGALATTCIVSSAYAVSGVVRGKILEVESNLPLPGSKITLLSDKNISYGGVTNVQGQFIIKNVPAGTYKYKASYIGYQGKEGTISVKDDQTAIIDLSLSSGTVIGKEIMVLGDAMKGQAKALNQQKQGNNIANIVSADQVGRFPDANIGDAMKRIPGITVQYDQGEARFGLIRGTAARLNSVTLNGERVPSAEAENREVQLDLIPSDMIATVEVNKAITPDMDADAIGGSVNLVTRTAPNGLRISGTAASGYNFLSEKPMLIGSAVIGTRFLPDENGVNRLGVIVSGSYFDHRLGSDNVEAEWDNIVEGSSGQDSVISPYVTDIQVRQYVVQRIRRSLSASFDYMLDENNTLTLSGMYNHRDDWENRYRLRYRDMTAPNAQGVVARARVVRETKGGINDNRVDNARLEDQRTMNFTLSGDHLFVNKLKVNWNATYAKASEERPNERYIAYRSGRLNLTPNISNTREPDAAFTDPASANTSGWGLNTLTEQYGYTEDVDFNSRLDFELPLIADGEYRNVLKFGGRLRSKSKKRENTFTNVELRDDNDPLQTMDGSKIDLEDITKDNYLAGNYRIGNFVRNTYLGNLNLNDNNRFELVDNPEEYAGGNFDATETITGGYAMLTQQIGSEISVIAGLRIENTSNKYNGNEFGIGESPSTGEDTTFVNARSGSSSYLNVLPALHVRYAPTNDLVIRAAWTNTIARPNYFDLVPYRIISIDDNELSEGNPDLKATTSMNFDLMAENYFESIGLISAGVFYKKIDNFIYNYQARGTQVTIINPVTGEPFSRYSQPRNGATADLVGVELSVQRQLDFLPGFLRYFGIYANYTYTKSSTTGFGERDNEDLGLPGTAENMFNGSLSYEYSGLTLRVSLNYTSAYLDELGSRAFLDRFYDTQTFVDVNGSYAFTPEFRFFFEVNNLTNQPLRYYQGQQELTMQSEFYNVRFNAGIKFDL